MLNVFISSDRVPTNKPRKFSMIFQWYFKTKFSNFHDNSECQKTEQGKLIAATCLVILLKFDPNHRFFIPCDLEIWCMTSKNYRATLLYYIKLCVSFQIHRWIQTEVTLRKRSIRVEIGDSLSLVTLKFDGWPWKTVGHLLFTTSSFVHHFKSIGELKLKLQSGNAQFGSNSTIFWAVWSCNLPNDLENNRAPVLCYFKLCASFCSNWWIQTGVTVWKRPIWVKFADF